MNIKPSKRGKEHQKIENRKESIARQILAEISIKVDMIHAN